MSIKAGNTVEASISQSGIGSRANICEHQEGNTIATSSYQHGIGSRANIRKLQEHNTIEVSIFGSGIDSRPIYVRIYITGLEKLVAWDSL